MEALVVERAVGEVVGLVDRLRLGAAELDVVPGLHAQARTPAEVHDEARPERDHELVGPGLTLKQNAAPLELVVRVVHSSCAGRKRELRRRGVRREEDESGMIEVEPAIDVAEPLRCRVERGVAVAGFDRPAWRDPVGEARAEEHGRVGGHSDAVELVVGEREAPHVSGQEPTGISRGRIG